MATLRQPARDLPLVGTGSRVLSPAERFPRDFWLTPRTVLTRKTPMSKLQTFCIRHGKCGRSLTPIGYRRHFANGRLRGRTAFNQALTIPGE